MLSPLVVKTCICSVAIVGSILLYVITKQKKTVDEKRNRQIKTSRQTTYEIKIPKSCVPAIIGRSGYQIKSIQEQTQTQIFFHDSTDNTIRLCIIRGKPENVILADSIIRNIIASQPVTETYEMQIPNSAVGRLIGIGGTNIRIIQRESNTKVRFGAELTDKKTGEEMREISIIGSAENVKVCISMIERTVTEEDDLKHFPDDVKNIINNTEKVSSKETDN